MQVTGVVAEREAPAFLRLGFRPFFLGGAIFGAISIVLWLGIYRGVISLSLVGGGQWWHIHEMIFGFGGAIIAGFLLTAVQTWTGIRGVQGYTLLMLFIFWLLARFTMLFSSFIASEISSVLDLFFIPAVAFILAKPIVATKQYRNLFFMPLLLVFTIANLEMHAALYYPKLFSMTFSGYAGVLLITFLMLVIAGRVVPMFTANGTKTNKVAPILMLDIVANGSLGVVAFYLLLQPLVGFSEMFFGGGLVFSGFFQTMRWLRWRPWITLNVPLLWSLHIAIKFICFGLVLLGISFLMPEVPTSHAWHLLTVGGMGGVILAMISRVSLGHTGRPLIAPKLMIIAYILIILSGVLRVFGPWLVPYKTILFIDISGTFWALSFIIFVIIYCPMLIKARLDGKFG